MKIETIKPGIAAVIAKSCGITKRQAAEMVDEAVKPISGRRKIQFKGLGDVLLEARRTSQLADEITGNLVNVPSEVVIEFSVRDARKVIKLGGLEGDPITPPPDMPPARLEGDAFTAPPGAKVYFTLEGDPWVLPPTTPPPAQSSPSVRIESHRSKVS